MLAIGVGHHQLGSLDTHPHTGDRADVTGTGVDHRGMVTTLLLSFAQRDGGSREPEGNERV